VCRRVGIAQLVLIVLGTACSPATTATVTANPSNAQGTSAFIGVNVLPMITGDSILYDQTVLVRNGIVTAVGPVRSTPVPAEARRIDGRGQYLVPGLIDAHVHLEYFDDPAILALFVASGVTTVRNMDGRPYLLDWRRRVGDGGLIGPAIHTAGPILDGNPPVRDDNTVVRDAAEARAAVEAQDSAGYDFVKVYAGISPEAYHAAVSAARERDKLVAGHVPRRLSLLDVFEAGQHSVEHLMDFDEAIESDTSSFRGRFHWSKLYLAMPADPGKISAAARSAAAWGGWIVPTMVQAERALAPTDSVRAWLTQPEAAYMTAEARAVWEQMATRATARMDSADWQIAERGRVNRRALLRALRDAGARVAIGTDTPNPFVVPGFSVHEELALFVEAGFTPREALLAATREAARLLGLHDSIGTVEPGRRADLILLPGNPLRDLQVSRRPSGVMLRGRWFSSDRLDALLQSVGTRGTQENDR
jgi:imidazolonepropionase-like amidohydrolase